jgi:hypothetical protein
MQAGVQAATPAAMAPAMPRVQWMINTKTLQSGLLAAPLLPPLLHKPPEKDALPPSMRLVSPEDHAMDQQLSALEQQVYNQQYANNDLTYRTYRLERSLGMPAPKGFSLLQRVNRLSQALKDFSAAAGQPICAGIARVVRATLVAPTICQLAHGAALVANGTNHLWADLRTRA